MAKVQDREDEKRPAKGAAPRRAPVPPSARGKEEGARAIAVGSIRIEAVLAGAERSGLLRGKTGRIGGRVSPVLIERAKANTGISGDTELLEFALANVALEDNFAESFKKVRGTVDPELKLGF